MPTQRGYLRYTAAFTASCTFIWNLLREFWRGGSFGTRERLINTSTSSLQISIVVKCTLYWLNDQADAPDHLRSAPLDSAPVGVYCKRYLQVELRIADMHASCTASVTGFALHDICAARYSWRGQIVVFCQLQPARFLDCTNVFVESLCSHFR
jgi:hypothetical protein